MAFIRGGKVNPKLEKIILNLKSRNALPKKMDMTSVGPYSYANVYDEVNSAVISDSVACGFDKDPATALMKSLSEFIETKAFHEGFKNGIASCQTERSDGFAAYPTNDASICKAQARKNARAEAIERFVWANWWDDESIGFTVKKLNDINLTQAQTFFCEEIQKSFSVEKIIAVYPYFENVGSENLVIFVGFLKNGGVVSGGACGEKAESTTDRALSELYRHGLSIKRMRDGLVESGTFYEKRLWFFSTPKGQTLAEQRLSKVGTAKIILPTVKFDEEVPHAFSDLFYVHRYLFDNQPKFIGGQLERFCI
jgi:hypothetical protein